MRGEIRYDGVRLTRVMPVAWVLTAGLTIAVNGLAATGYPITHPGVQSVILVTLFIGGIALSGTVQKVHELRDAGRRTNALVTISTFLGLSLCTMGYGLWSYFM